MDKETYYSFLTGAKPVFSKPKPYHAKRIVSVRCVNPTAKISYHYQRLHEMTFEDGSTYVQHEDHWCRPDVHMKHGNYVVAAGAGLTLGFYTPEEFAATFSAT